MSQQRDEILKKFLSVFFSRKRTRSACFALLLMPMSLYAGGLHGTWCSDGEMLHFDAFGVGANEHTVCDATPPPAETDSYYNASLTCRNVYPGAQKADGTIEITEVPLDGPDRIVAILIGTDQLAVLFGIDGKGVLYDRCG